MFSFFLPLVLAQAISIPVPPPPANTNPVPNIQTPTPTPSPEEPQEIIVPQVVRPLTGSLDNVPVLNSNSPELIFNDGIIISTLPSIGMGSPYAHLNFPFKGRFDVFAHHVVQASPENRTLYVGILLFNGRSQPVTVDVLQGSAYRTSPDALFRDLLGELPALVEDPNGTAYAGPGSRSTGDILRGKRQPGIPAQILIPPGQSQMLVNVPVPVSYTPDPTKPPPFPLPRNGFSAYYRLNSSGEVFAASMAMYAPLDAQGNERAPTVQDWQRLLQTGSLMQPRDRIPRNSKRRIYSRVAGVSIGSQWQANLTDPNSDTLAIPASGQAYSYPVSTLEGGRLGTKQNQSAKMTERYPDTAYEAHGNYGVQYSLTMPLVNNTGRPQEVTIALESPIKEDQLREKDSLRFLVPSPKNVFFRGTVQFRYLDDQGTMQNRYFHVILKRGQQGNPLITLNLKAGDRRTVQVDLVYPADSTPPQIITVKTR